MNNLKENPVKRAHANSDVNAVDIMLNMARKNELECEVVWSALRFVRDGNSIKNACNMALKDWDL